MPEMIVRRLLHANGYRYQLHRKDLPGCPDLVFPGRRAVILIHGCWWHAHRCKRGQSNAITNASFWHQKRERNKARDARVKRKLRQLKWRVLVIWECQLKDHDNLAQRLFAFL